MVRRSSLALATILALIAILLAVVPVAAYNSVNHYHLRLTRLDPIVCGTPIRIRATLTDKDGDAVSGKTVHFEITKGEPGDSVSPHDVTTNSQGNATTVVTLVCASGEHDVKVKATGPNGARARIWLEQRRHEDHPGGDHWWWGSRDTIAILASTTGSTGTGTGPQSPVGGSGPSFLALLPVGSVALGGWILLTAYRRRTALRIARPATA